MTTYDEWRREAVRWVDPVVARLLLERHWKRFYVQGLSPAEAADRASTKSHNERVEAGNRLARMRSNRFGR